jgi:hypothetical protein
MVFQPLLADRILSIGRFSSPVNEAIFSQILIP